MWWTEGDQGPGSTGGGAWQEPLHCVETEATDTVLWTGERTTRGPGGCKSAMRVRALSSPLFLLVCVCCVRVCVLGEGVFVPLCSLASLSSLIAKSEKKKGGDNLGSILERGELDEGDSVVRKRLFARPLSTQFEMGDRAVCRMVCRVSRNPRFQIVSDY